MSTPRIQLTVDCNQLRPGDEATGTVGIEPGKGEVHSVTVELRKTTRWKISSGDVDPTIGGLFDSLERMGTEVVAVASIPSAEGRHRFSLEVPNEAPPSVHDEELSRDLRDLVAWDVHAVASRKVLWGWEATETIQVLSPAGQYSEWASRQAEATEPTSNCALGVQPHPRAVRPGESLSGTLVLTARRAREAKEVKVRLERRRCGVLGRSGLLSEKELLCPLVFVEEECILCGPMQMAADETYSWPFELRVSEAAPPSFRTPNNELHWFVVGTVAVARGPRGVFSSSDTREVEIVVYTAGDDDIQPPSGHHIDATPK